MQQIEEIRRMSELAKQMRELGLAKDNADAFQQARSITSSDPAVAAERKQEELQSKVAMLERKVDTHARSIDDLKAQLESGGRSLADAIKKIQLFESKLRDLEATSTANIAPIPEWRSPSQMWTEPVREQQAPAVWNQPYPPQVQTQERAPAAAPIDRNGVAPADVSVEKFFYFGNKR